RGADASSFVGRGRRPTAPVGAGGATAPARGRRYPGFGAVVRATGHGQDHAGQPRVHGHRAPIRGSVGLVGGREGGQRSHRGGAAAPPVRPRGHRVVHRRGAPVLQDPAGRVVGGGGGPHRAARRGDHGESVVLGGRAVAVAVAG